MHMTIMATTSSKSQHITVLPQPTWLEVAGMSKGIHHDRQHLGIILAAGQEIKVRQTNTAFTEDITLHLLNNDGNTETSKKVGSNWVPLSVNAVAVPFIDTPYTSGVAPVVEYEYPNNSKSLPVYHRGESESAFFSAWESQNAEFGLIEADYAIILVPEVSKNDLKKLKEVKNIDGLIGYYESIFTFYNALTGVSFEPQHASDLNIRNRYFLKADKTGPGGAYYSDIWTAESSASVSSFWLEPVATNWGSLHEIGHGYQGNFMQDKYLSTGEVWNNIYAAGYQSVMLGDRKYEEGWMYGYGNQEGIEKNLHRQYRCQKGGQHMGFGPQAVFHGNDGGNGRLEHFYPFQSTISSEQQHARFCAARPCSVGYVVRKLCQCWSTGGRNTICAVGRRIYHPSTA
jgi:hypothetical protein